MTKFYMGFQRSYPYDLVPWIEEHNVPLLSNAAHRWSDRTERLNDVWEYDTDHVVDSGGYNVQSQNDDIGDDELREELSENSPFYPWTIDQYHEWLQEHSHEIEWAAAMDYACEERFDELWSVEERVDATIENTVEQWHKDRGYKLLPVLQGRSVDQYVECAERMMARGVDVSHVGLGTVCRINDSEEIVAVEQAVRDRVDEIEDIHGFGVKIKAFDMGAGFDSADSFAWNWASTHGEMLVLENNDYQWETSQKPMRDDPRTATCHSFKVYYAVATLRAEGEAAVDMEPLLEAQKQFDHTAERPDDSESKDYHDDHEHYWT